MKNPYDLLDKEDLTPDLKMICDVCGLETVKAMLRHLSGLSFYIPKISRLDGFVKRFAKENESRTLKEIAKELNVTASYLKKKLSEKT